MKSYKSYFLIVFFIIRTITSLSQTKNEKEVSAERNVFPKQAIELLNHLPKEIKRLKYYKETDGNKVSFEAKFKYQKRKFSIEFDKLGNLEDIEITLRKRDIPENIESYFESNYIKHHFFKVQRQYKKEETDDAIELLEKALKYTFDKHTNFEIIAQVQNPNSKYQLIEFTFNSKGRLLNSRTLQARPYEYILY